MEEIKKITLNDPDYPFLLKKIPNPPKILYYKGKIYKKEPLFSIVGPRKYSSYGKRAVFDIGGCLVEQGLIVASGLAPGIDTFAHLCAIQRKKRTIAVLGTGLDEKSIYPKENIALARKILENNGCLISEYPPGTRGTKFTFPQRNRIIAGLSFGVLVIESKEKGGAMITAEYASRYKRKVFALPGSIYSFNSRGAHKLIKEIGCLAENHWDIIKELKTNPLFQEIQENLPLSNFSDITEKTETLSKEEKKIIEILKKEALHIDEIIKEAKLNPSQTASCLSILEIKGKIKNLGGNIYALA